MQYHFFHYKPDLGVTNASNKRIIQRRNGAKL